jgi:hypothetical protein
MSTQAAIVKDEWWGFSSEHGWVVLDREIATNRPGKTGKLIFLCCSNWVRYEDERERWDRPYYIFSERYLESLNEKDVIVAREILASLKDEYQKRKEEFYSSVVQERHRQFLANAGRSAPKTVRARKKSRASYCWNCRQPVDNSIDLECSGCGWIICGSCGACGCTYGANETNCRLSELAEGSPHQESNLPPSVMDEKIFSSFKDASQYAKDNPGSKLSRINDGNAWKVESA